MEIEKVKTDVLIPYVRNARTHSDEQVTQICGSIKEFGFTNPVLIDSDKVIIAGHGRVMAAQRMGLSEVPCITLDYLTEAQKKAYIIADNQLALNAGWNEELLALEIEELNDLDFNLDLLGFDDPLKFLPDKEGHTDEDEVPDVPDNPVTKEGDLWVLGNHKILCGNSTSVDDVEKLLNKQKVDLLLTDPPYGVNYAEKNTFLNAFDEGNRNQKHIKNDEIENIEQFCKDFLSIIPFSDYNIFYIFFAGLQLHHLRTAIEDTKLYFSQYLIWNKNNHVLGRNNYMYKHEFIVYGWKNRHKFYGGKSTSVLNFDRPVKSDLHPTMKPVAILEKLIKDGSLSNQNIYDPFLGSGSTLLAAEKTTRKCFGLELEPTYCDVIIERWQNYTQEKAILESNGKTFEELKNSVMSEKTTK